MNAYLAKSDGETIIEHTQELLTQWQLLKKLYPKALDDDDWKLLEDACKYHDLGKINSKFQAKLIDHRSMEQGEIPHALLSISLLPENDLLNEGFSREQVTALTYAIALHHNRNLEDVSPEQYQEEILQLRKEVVNFPFDKLGILAAEPHLLSGRYYRLGYYPNIKKDYYHEFLLLKGLLNRLDYAASGHYQVESSPRISVDSNVLGSWKEKKPEASWNRLQEWSKEHNNQSIVIIGQTGLGKTEGALRWIGNDKGFFLLPLKSAINSIYNRLSENYKIDNQHLSLLHSDIMAFLLQKENKDVYGLRRQINEARALSKQLTVATLDQIFNFVYHYQGYEAKLATLSYSKVVIDEIQMYSASLLAYILYGLRLIQDYGGRFEVMTATLAPFILDLMKKQGLEFIQPSKPFLNKKLLARHSVKVVHQQISADEILDKYRNNKVLVVCNTVRQAEKVYDEISKQIDEVYLIHSRFIRKDRSKLERKICAFGQSNNHEHGIWIGTQVVEASLDIDFDILMTELSELNGLFQRMGRCYRKRSFDNKNEKYNVYVFDGGSKDPSGINDGKHSVVDYGMYKLAKERLGNVDGIVDESEKLAMIDDTYTTPNIKQVSNEYLENIKNTIHFLRSIRDDHLDRNKVRQYFRNINTIDVIPEEVLDQYKTKISSLIDILTNQDFTRKQKLLARASLNEYTVSVPLYMAGDNGSNLVSEPELEKVGYHILSKIYHYDAHRGLDSSIRKVENDNIF